MFFLQLQVDSAARWDKAKEGLQLGKFFAEKMEEIGFGPTALSAHKVRSTFIYGPAEKSAVLTVATLLARNVYHIGGTLAVPQKCRLTQIGKCVCVCVSLDSITQCALERENPNT